MTPDATGPKPKPAPKKVFDVMKPGKAMASPSGRPIIVGHKPLVHDSVSGVGSDGPSLQHKRKIELTQHDEPQAEAVPKPEPIQTPEPAEKPAPKPEAAEQAAVAVNAPEPEAQMPPAPVAPETQPKAEEPDPMTPVFDAPGPGAQAMPPAPEDSKSAFDDTPAPIPDHQEIIVSHHGPLDEPFKVIGLILLILVLAAVAVDILLDAGVLTIQSLPHTNFFK